MRFLLVILVGLGSGVLKHAEAQTYGLAVYVGGVHTQYDERDGDVLTARDIDPRLGFNYTVSVDTAFRFSIAAEFERALFDLDYENVSGPQHVAVRIERLNVPVLGQIRFHSTELDELRACIGIVASFPQRLQVDRGRGNGWSSIEPKNQIGLAVRGGFQYGLILSEHWRIFGEIVADVHFRQDFRDVGARVPVKRTFAAGANVGLGFNFQ